MQPDPSSLLEPSRLTYTPMVTALALGLLPLVALLLAALARWDNARRLAASSRRAVQATPPTAPGPVVLEGVVETVDDDVARPVIELVIRQAGTEHSNKGNHSHTWRETSRAIAQRPFELELAGGERVRVEPKRVALVDQLEAHARPSTYVREVWAHVDRGDRVTVSGEMRPRGAEAGSGYRDRKARLALCAPRGGVMLVSSEPLEKRFAARASLAARAAVVALVGLALHVSMFANAYVLLARGKVVSASVEHVRVDERYHSTKSGGYYTKHHVLEAHAFVGDKYAALEAEVHPNAKAYGLPVTVPFVVDPSKPSRHAVGGYPHVTRAHAFVGLLPAAVAWLACLVVRRRKMPWYERKLVVNKGTGRLSSAVS